MSKMNTELSGSEGLYKMIFVGTKLLIGTLQPYPT
jgi:hypothetical protein